MSLINNELFNPTLISSAKNNDSFFNSIASSTTSYYSVMESNNLTINDRDYLTVLNVNIQTFYLNLYQILPKNTELFSTLGRMAAANIYDLPRIPDLFKSISIFLRLTMYLLTVIIALTPFLDGNELPSHTKFLISKTYYKFLYNAYRNFESKYGSFGDYINLPELSNSEKNVITIIYFIYQVLNCIYNNDINKCKCGCDCKCNKTDNKENIKIYQYLYDLTRLLYEAIASVSLLTKKFTTEAYTLIDKILYQLKCSRCIIQQPVLHVD